jgi:hypothetical protein
MLKTVGVVAYGGHTIEGAVKDAALDVADELGKWLIEKGYAGEMIDETPVLKEPGNLMEKLAEEEAKKARGEFPEEWRPEKAGEIIVGKVDRIEEAEYDYHGEKRKAKVAELTTAAGARTVWLSRAVLAKEFERKGVKVGDTVAIKFLGKPEGKDYFDYAVAVER